MTTVLNYPVKSDFSLLEVPDNLKELINIAYQENFEELYEDNFGKIY